MILITGYKGFIGSNLVKRFKQEDLILLDINDCYSINHIDWSNIEKIYHVGAISSTTETNVGLIYDYNVRYSLNLFELAIKHQVPVVYLSSASVFGNSLTYQYNPLNFYSTSKVFVDLYIENNISSFKNIAVIRPFNVYGANEEHKKDQASPITKFALQAQSEGCVRVFEGSENFLRDFIWVEDLIDCMLEDLPSGFYDGGTSNAVSFQHVAELISSKYNKPIVTIPFPKHLKGKYQSYTRARTHFDKKFVSVDEFILNK